VRFLGDSVVTTCGAVVVVEEVPAVPDHLNADSLQRFLRVVPVLHHSQPQTLNGNCNDTFLLLNIFGFRFYISNMYYVKLSTEKVIS